MAHPIESIMRTTMENLKDMIDVSTVVGEAVLSGDGLTIIPISKVSFGFVAGGGEYNAPAAVPQKPNPVEGDLPFGGGTGAGVTVSPVGFLVVGSGQVKMLSASCNSPVDRLVELVPQLVCDVRNILKDHKDSSAGGATGPEDYPPYSV